LQQQHLTFQPKMQKALVTEAKEGFSFAHQQDETRGFSAD
jgi:hypothetical protein